MLPSATLLEIVMKTSNILAALALTALTACGGGGSDNSQPKTPVAVSPVCVAKTVTIAVEGDSTNHGYDGYTGGLNAHTPSMLLQSEMDARFGTGAVVVTDYSVSGTTATQAPVVVADEVIGNFGINDARLGEDINVYANALRQQAATIIETPSPVSSDVYSWASALPMYVDAAKDVAEERNVPVADVNAYVLGLPNWQAMLSDGAHHTEALDVLIIHNVLAPVVIAKIAPLRCQ
jgi:acyl-CoA thioesterase I